MNTVKLEQVNVSTEGFYSGRTRQLLQLLNDPNMYLEANKIIAEAIKPYIPKDTGALQDSVVITPKEIIWGVGLSYAHYQYMGVVYEKNYPITKNGVIVGWYSKGSKTPSMRTMGHFKGSWKGWFFGYTNGASVSQWTKMYEWQLKSQTNLEITKMLKAECRKRGLST